MQIDRGIQSNCSETVFRIPSKYQIFVNKKLNIYGPDNYHHSPVEGYSQMRPTKGTVCYYYYQTSGADLQDFLEENEISYDIQSPFGDIYEGNSDSYERICLNKEEKLLDHNGGGGECYRRKSYGNRKRTTTKL